MREARSMIAWLHTLAPSGWSQLRATRGRPPHVVSSPAAGVDTVGSGCHGPDLTVLQAEERWSMREALDALATMCMSHGACAATAEAATRAGASLGPPHNE